jgi:hypothetical protein
MEHIPFRQDMNHFTDDAMSEASDETILKHLHPFEDESRLEDALPRRKPRSWWDLMVARIRRKSRVVDSRPGVTEALLEGELSLPRKIRQNRPWYNYFVFAGISGTTIL